MTAITVFSAQKIVTLDPDQPQATHVAVKDGRILALGDASCADQWGAVRHDDSLSDCILAPGFVEGHAHMMAGAMWQYVYAGYHDRADPNGKLWSGLSTLDAVVARLKDQEAQLPEGQPLVAWGLDPIFLPGERLSKVHLDQVSTTRAIMVMFSNFHLLCANSVALDMVGYGAHTNAEGVVKGTDGEPTGELQEMAAMFPLMRRLGADFRALSMTDDAVKSYAQVCNRAGVTTATDLYSTMEERDLARLLALTGADDFPLRLVPALGANAAPETISARALTLRAHSTDKLRMGAVKIMTDGSIQGWTARVRWPGYVGGQPNGIWNTAPDQIRALCLEMQRAGLPMHIHVNGDEASEVTIEALAQAKAAHPRPGLRHVLQHAQMMDAAQFARARELDLCVNLFANHIWYFGDQHAALTIGETRAARMDACRAALDAGVGLSIHSDAPVTPLGPLFTAWCAETRKTMSGRTLGAAQRITRGQALHAITMGPAHSLGLDAEIGSITPGKRADFALLDACPLTTPDLRDITVKGTVLGGTIFRT
ncbi:amidohydrolase [Tropicibacter alexandrii]|uniref:amidohydrolase n=1 Tax=Tropicibacter alexandrii TaxID=2267683 RepID=UPI000EF4F01A|nr:amidohydrolase [Tropicibacter alexandrii]